MQPSGKQEFFTLDSRLTIQRGNIYQKKLKYNEEVWNRSAVFILLIVFLLFTIYEIAEEKKYGSIIQLILVLLWLSPHVKRIYQTLFVKTWRSIIPLKNIKAITSEPLDNGLETKVTLHLSSGRKKYYTFRNAEDQVEPFVEAVSVNTPVTTQVAL